MSYKIVTETYFGSTTMSVRSVVPRNELGAAIGTESARVGALLEAGGIPPLGPPYVRYHDATDASFDIEVGYPVAAWSDVPDLDRTELPAGRIAATTHIGHYSGLPEATGALRDWVGANAESAGGCWEIYWTDPRQTSIEEWRTDILWPIR